jgi:UDP-N-acetylglucosamine 2-epimerase
MILNHDICAMKPVLEGFKPDYVFVHGDTTTTGSTVSDLQSLGYILKQD